MKKKYNKKITADYTEGKRHQALGISDETGNRKRKAEERLYRLNYETNNSKQQF